jgi:hypothetical protein
VIDGNFHTSTGNSLKAGGGGSGGRRSFSTLAGGNTANFTFGSVPAGGGGSKRPLSTVSTLSPLTSHRMVEGINTLGYGGGSSRFLSGCAASQRPAEPAISRPHHRFPHLVNPADAIVAPWSRLLARLPRKW